MKAHVPLPGAYAKVSARSGYVVITLRGEFDMCTAARILPAFTAPAASGATMIVDLSDLAFMDASSLRELAAVRAQARRAGGDLLLTSPQPIVHRLLSLTDVINHWPLSASVDEAVRARDAPPSLLAPRAEGTAD